jgi:hypothetical protein
VPTVTNYVPGGITIVIQGPINKTSLDNIHRYIKYGPVVVHAWEYESYWRHAEKYNNLVREIKQRFGDMVTVVLDPMPDSDKLMSLHAPKYGKPWCRNQFKTTFHLAMRGILLALDHVETKHVIRLRSDEYYTDLDPYMENLSTSPDAFVMGNIFAAPMTQQEFHIGDHIYACKADTLYKACKSLVDFYDNIVEPKWHSFLKPWAPEQVLALSWLEASGIEPPSRFPIPNPPHSDLFFRKMCFSSEYIMKYIYENSQEHKPRHKEQKAEIVRQFYRVVDINKTGPFIARHNHAGKTFYNEFVNPHGVCNIGDMLDGY